MKSSRLTIIFALVLLFSALFAGFAFAEDEAPTIENNIKSDAQSESFSSGYQDESPQRLAEQSQKSSHEYVAKTVNVTGGKLPDTATPIFNYIVVGLGFAFVGIISLGMQQYHQKRKHSGDSPPML